jgi:hypothetical protein
MRSLFVCLVLLAAAPAAAHDVNPIGIGIVLLYGGNVVPDGYVRAGERIACRDYAELCEGIAPGEKAEFVTVPVPPICAVHAPMLCIVRARP